jgi:hypothetical protein
MSFAQNYTPTTSFATDESNSVAGRSTIKTVSIDTELANISTSINALNTNLKLIQRDDGKIQDGEIEPYALSTQTRALLAGKGTARGNWLPNTDYLLSESVQYSSIAYICLTNHNSGSAFSSSLWMAISDTGLAATFAADAALSAASADTSEANALSSANTATTQAGIATTQAGIATTQATNAANSAISAANSIAGSIVGASQAEALAGTDNSKYMTSLRVLESSAKTIQNQSATAFTTGGTSSAFTVTTNPAVTTYTNSRLAVTLNATPTGSPTINYNGLGAKSFKYKDSIGTKQFVTSAQAKNGHLCDLWYDGTDVMLLNPLQFSAQIQPITASVASNAMTLTLNPTLLEFRSATLGSGTTIMVSVPTAISTVISAGSTGGTVSAVASRIAVLAINNAGTVELAWCNISGGVDLSETGLISTTAEGGAGAADSATVVYSTTARTNVAYRVVGYVDSTQTTAGTWATAPSTIQGAGGQALSALVGLGNGQTWQDLTASRAQNVTYTNSTGRAIDVTGYLSCTTANNFQVLLNGNIMTFQSVVLSGVAGFHIVVPHGATYLVNPGGANFNLTKWWELR